MVDVYLTRVDCGQLLTADDVPKSQRPRIERFQREKERRRFVCAWGLSARLLGERMGVEPANIEVARVCTRCGGDHGKPAIPGSGLDISISHSDDRIAVAISDAGQVGVDIERKDIDEWPEAMSDLVLAPQENLADSRHRSVFWTRKEAVLKSTGDGLMLPMSGIRVSPPSSRAKVLGWRDRPELVDRIMLYDLIAPPGYTISLAVLDDPSRPTGHADPLMPEQRAARACRIDRVTAGSRSPSLTG